MKKLFTLILGVFSLMSFAQSKYESGMQKALQQWKDGQPKEAMAMLDRLAASDKENWIPVYYKVFIGITQGFNNPTEENTIIIIENNRAIIEDWIAVGAVGGEEWYVLKGMNETLELITDPMTKGMTQSPIIVKAYEEAVKLNPNNPRAVYSLASFHLNSAKYTKVDVPYYKKMLERSIELFDQQKSEVLFFPSWGKDWAVKTLSNFSRKE